MTPDDFVERWKKSGGAELANSQLFLTELCDLLGVPHPDGTTTDTSANKYVFEKAVEFNNGDGTTSNGRVDLFKAGCFVLESKQGSERKAAEAAEALATKTKTVKKLTGTAERETRAWERAMQAARKQAKGYAEAIPDEWPPFLIVTDVGFCFDIYADFSGTGKNYVPFPDPRGFRIHLDRLRDERVRDLFQKIWSDPHSLDPSKKSAKVTREIAERLAKLAKSLEKEHETEVVAGFLMRCLFTMFAEDVELLRPNSFTELLMSLRTEPENFKPMAESLWESMDEGKFSTILREKVKQFNGRFFKDKTALALNHDQVELLVEAANYRWEEVEPAIFGTLLERALDPAERHKLGAHYTPRAYVERLVMPTVIEPLREQWDAIYAAATKLDEDGKRDDARKLIRKFHGQLCETRVLDPACGSGNFLYVSMELMKRLEGEVLNTMREYDETVLPGLTIDPHQFLGIEVNPRAAALAELVLWIGSIQWYKRTRDTVNIPEPILKDYGNIECRDALIVWDSIEPVVDDAGNPVTRWDGRTTKPHPVTGKEIPDEDARVQELCYINPQKAEWPDADYIVGNPPFVGNKRMRKALGTGYTKAIREAWPELGASTDFVMYWWHRAASILGSHFRAHRFGFITTNSISQKFNRKVVNSWLSRDISLIFAVPDHPWVDTAFCADVRISMSVALAGDHEGILLQIQSEKINSKIENAIEFCERRGNINPDFTIGVSIEHFQKLKSNLNAAFRGVIIGGESFLVQEPDLKSWQPYEINKCRLFHTGRDLTQAHRKLYVIDLFPEENEGVVRTEFPSIYQRLRNGVFDARQNQDNEWRKQNWWLLSDPARGLRQAVVGLERYIVTPRTAEHRTFQFVDAIDLVESEVVAFALQTNIALGVLSSRPHIVFSTFAPGAMGVGNQERYVHSERFPVFPFPVANDDQKNRISELADQLDSHRKRQQELHPTLTMTGMYNVLEKLRAGKTLTKKEQAVHEQGLVSVLKQIHDDLDAAVFDAYGWPHDLEDDEILHRLVELNHERAEEESRGVIRWLHPEFQNPDGATQTGFIDKGKTKTTKKAAAKVKKQPWPKTLPERMVAIQSALQRHAAPADAKELAAYYTRANKSQVNELLETLAAVGNVRQLDNGRYVI